MPRSVLLTALALLLTQTACTRDPVSPALPTGTLTYAPPELVGTWTLENGSMMDDFVGGLATFGVTTDVTAIRIGSDGTGDVWLRDRLTDAKDRVRAFVFYDDDDYTLVFDFAAEPTTDFQFNLAVNRQTYVYPIVSRTARALRIADADGRVALLERVSTLPNELDPKELEVLARYDGVPRPQFFTDMVLFNGDLAYASSVQLETFSLTTQSVGDPLGPVSSRMLQTTQGGFFWTHCACGGSRDAFKRTLTTVFDTVSSEDEMGGPITFRAMAYDPMADRLWLHGRPFDSQFGQFWVMNTNGEPDVIDRSLSFNRDLRALAFDGSDLWGIETVATQVVVRIDPVDGKVIESYEIPDLDVSWSGLVFGPDGMYLLGTTLDDEGVILLASRPAAPRMELASE
ncbi:MAG: hypothetical protein KC591_17470 [Gemmatimonadetes bacterium]|nr:hypothetical protein [Gemmatimonadota bacterium]